MVLQSRAHTSLQSVKGSFDRFDPNYLGVIAVKFYFFEKVDQRSTNVVPWFIRMIKAIEQNTAIGLGFQRIVEDPTSRINCKGYYLMFSIIAIAFDQFENIGIVRGNSNNVYRHYKYLVRSI